MKFKLKEKIRSGRIVVGGFLNYFAPELVESMGVAGCDFFVLDNEHGCFSPNEMVHMIRAADAVGMSTIVRVDYDRSGIQKALDMGAEGVQIPKINTPEEAEFAVCCAKYPPLGDRGVGFSARAARLSDIKGAQYIDYANDNVLVVAQVETPEAIRNIDAILEVPGVDIAFLGKMDLSTAVGTPRNTQSPEMLRLTEDFFSAIGRHNVPAGYVYDGTPFESAFKQNALYLPSVVGISANVADTVKKHKQYLSEKYNNGL